MLNAIDIAYTAAQAKQQLAKQKYQAMTLDLVLPDQSGISLIKELRSQSDTRSLPIIVISGKAQEGRHALSGEGVSVLDWLDKPINPERLAVVINDIKAKAAKKPRILHIEDDTDISQIVADLLCEEAQLTRVATLKQAKQELLEKEYDLVILDLALPDGSGLNILPELADRLIPVIVFSVYELEQTYAKYVSKALIKSRTTNQELLNVVRAFAAKN